MTALFTRKHYEVVPEGIPVELLDGQLVKRPSPRFGHQRIQSRILHVLAGLLGPDRVAVGPVDVLVDELNVFVPDIVVHEHVPDDEAQYVGVPSVVFEILSPSTEVRDRDYKARRYLGLGVKEVWLIDRARRRIEVVDVDGTTPSVADHAASSRAVPGLELVPEHLFAQP
ncbi:MAG: Uma2 family endonuclease [Planctomycetota bacterium]